MVTFTHEVGDSYVITGVDAKGKRFRITTTNLYYAWGHNVYKGTLWQIKKGDKRKKKIKTWNN